MKKNSNRFFCFNYIFGLLILSSSLCAGDTFVMCELDELSFLKTRDYNKVVKLASDKYIKNEFDKRKIVGSANCKGNKGLNFGVVVNNPYYQIYRSSGLGKKGLKDLETHLGNSKLLPRKIVYLNKSGYGKTKERVENLAMTLFKKIKGGPTYALKDFAVEEMKNSYFPKSKVKFDFFHSKGNNKKNLYMHGNNPLNEKLKLVRFKSMEGGGDGTVLYSNGGRDSLYNVLETILKGKGPSLFHCKGGLHRTGMAALMIRYLQGNEWVQPFDKNGGVPMPIKIKYKNAGLKNLNNPAEYEYYTHNLNNFREENMKAIKELSKDKRFQCLKGYFQNYLYVNEKANFKCSTGSTEAISNPSKVKLKNFPRYVELSLKRCNKQFSSETEILKKINFAESVLDNNSKYKLRYKNGFFVANKDSVLKRSENKKLAIETARQINNLKDQIDDYTKMLKINYRKNKNLKRLYSSIADVNKYTASLYRKYNKMISGIRVKDKKLHHLITEVRIMDKKKKIQERLNS